MREILEEEIVFGPEIIGPHRLGRIDLGSIVNPLLKAMGGRVANKNELLAGFARQLFSNGDSVLRISDVDVILALVFSGRENLRVAR